MSSFYTRRLVSKDHGIIFLISYEISSCQCTLQYISLILIKVICCYHAYSPRRTFIFSDKLREREIKSGRVTWSWTTHNSNQLLSIMMLSGSEHFLVMSLMLLVARTLVWCCGGGGGGEFIDYQALRSDLAQFPPVLDWRSGRVLSCEESGDSPRETDRPPVLSSSAPSQGVSSPLNSGLTVTTQPPSRSPLAARKLLRPEALIWSGGKVLRGSAHTSLEMATSKRKCQDRRPEEEEELEGVREKRRRVEWRDVTIYNFKRRQGFVCVPSQVRLIYSRD